MNDYLKSIRTIIDDRITSPFYGTLIISWSLWNWKIFYVTFFISENKLLVNKIEYILANCNDWKTLILYPLISTIILISVFPLITNAAYLINLHYNNWKVNKKNEIENRQLLTIGQSIEIRSEIRNQEEKFKLFLETKNAEIENLKHEIEFLNSKKPTENKEKLVTLENIVSSFDSIKQFQALIRRIDASQSIIGYLNNEKIDFFIKNNIIKPKKTEGYFSWTTEGDTLKKQFQKYIEKEES